MAIPRIWVLMGFKSVGKSTIGQALAQVMHCHFFDLDRLMEEGYHDQHQSSLTSRQIMYKHGEKFFSQLEHMALTQMLNGQTENCVLALGGRTPLNKKNQWALKNSHVNCLLIYLQARKDEVFARMMKNGRPAFISEGKDTKKIFSELWNKRLPVYEQLADITVANTGNINQCTNKILKKIKQRGELL